MQAVTERYEQLRAGVLAGNGEGLRFGLGVLASRGMAAWMTLWQQVPSAPPTEVPTKPATAAPSGGAGEMVRILASMALAHV
jgi:hypothetical protein